MGQEDARIVLPGKRKRRRPIRSWKNDIEEVMKHRRLNEECRLDTTAWKQGVEKQ